MTGLFLSFEGIDGSGKSTQARLLADHLKAAGRDVVLTREPGGSPGAEEIRRLVLEGDPDRWSAETELLLFTAARRDHLERIILPGIERGAVVISDRFADSTRVYQGTTRGDLTKTVNILHDAVIGIEPDRTFLIDIDPVTLDYWQRLKTARKGSDSCAAVARLLLVAIGFQKYLGELAPLLVRGWSTPVLNGRGNPHSRAWGAHALV